MIRPRANIYLALLLTLCLTAGAVVSVGDSQARPANAATLHNTILLPQTGAVKSDFLVSGGNQIVLLGELGSMESIDVDLTLENTRDFSGQLIWHAVDGAPVQIQMYFALLEGEGSLNEDHLLEMKAGSKAILTLVLTAPDVIETAATADVQVICGELGSTFRVTLLADEPVVTDPEEPTEPTEPDEPTEPEEEDTSVRVILPGEGDVDVVLPGEPGNPIQTTPDAAKAALKTLSEFRQNTPLPVKATLGGKADTLRIGLEEEALLPMTRFSTDGGQSWYVLYEGGYLELSRDPEAEEETEWLLLLDISMTDHTPEEVIRLEGKVFLNEQAITVCYAETVPQVGPEDPEAVRILKNPSPTELAQLTAQLGLEEEPSENGTEEPAAETETEENTETEPEQSVEPGSGVAEGTYFRVQLPPGWAECDEIRYWAELLTETQENTIDYVMVEWDPQQLNAVTDPGTGSVVVYMGGQSPAAGTYRLTLECMYEGICFHRMQTTFFINYSTPSDGRNEEVPEHE